MRKIQFISVLTALLLISIIQGFSASKLSRKYKQIQRYLNEATHDKLAGVVVYIRSPKHGEWIGTSGYSDLETKKPMAKDDVLAMASIGKMYNAVALMKLVEDGAIQLDDKIAHYLPSEIIDNLPNAKEITIRHLLGHTSGIINYELNTELNRLFTYQDG